MSFMAQVIFWEIELACLKGLYKDDILNFIGVIFLRSWLKAWPKFSFFLCEIFKRYGL